MGEYVSAAWVYVRLSEDKNKGTSKEGATVARQERDCRQWAADHDIEVLGVLTDNDVSATRSSYRKGFEQLLKKRPPAIIVWAQDRLLRLTKDLERVIELDVPVYTVMGGIIDLSTPTGRAVARTVAAWSTYEGEQRDTRQKSAQDEFHELGEPVPGKRRFGYLGASKDHRVNMKAHPAEAPIVKAMFKSIAHEDVEKRRSIKSWADELGWRRARVRETLANPAYMGVLTRAGQTYEARPEVDRLVSRELFDAAQAALATHQHAGRPGGVVTHLASGIGRCGVCDGPLSYRNGYLCLADLSHPTIKGEYVDDKIRSEMTTILMRQMTDEDSRTSTTLTVIEARLVQLDTDEEEWAQAKAGGMRWALIAPHLRELQDERKRLQDERSAIHTASTRNRVLASLRASVVDPVTRRVDMSAAGDLRREVRRRFDALDIMERRELIRAHLDIVVYRGRGPGRAMVAIKDDDDEEGVQLVPGLTDRARGVRASS